MSSARQSEVKAWEEEITPCEHTLTIIPQETGHIAQSGKFLSFDLLSFLMYYRTRDLQGMRSQGKPLALLDLWFTGLWQAAVWWDRREWSRFATL